MCKETAHLLFYINYITVTIHGTIKITMDNMPISIAADLFEFDLYSYIAYPKRFSKTKNA